MFPFRIKALLCTLVLLAATLYTFSQTAPFVDATPAGFGNINSVGGASSWADYDNDGDLDVCIAGLVVNQVGAQARIYRNNGNGSFTDLGTNFGARANDSKMTVIWFDYNNNGQMDLLLAVGGPLLLYENSGGTFTLVGNTGLPPDAAVSGVAAGDYDNDGYPDLAISGYINGSRRSLLFHNNRQGGFDLAGSAFLPVGSGDFGWADYDKDGLLDLMLTGSTGSTSESRLYRNLGNGNFSAGMVIGTYGVHNSSVAWGDYNNDGYPDLLLSGNNSQSPGNYLTMIYRNDNGTGFTNINAPLQGVSGNAVWGDYNNDGLLDVALAGQTVWDPTTSATQVYMNRGNDHFTLEAVLPSRTFSSISWADYNNDNRLDLLWIGSEVNGSFACMLFRNTTGTANSRPSAPTGLTHAVSADEKSVTFTWQPAQDAQTAVPGLYYNLYLYEDPGSAVKINGHSRSTGARRVVAMGNASMNTSYTFHGLSYNKVYRWSVQSIDAAWAGSAFAPEKSFATRKTQTIQLNDLTHQYGDPDFIPATVNSGLPLIIQLGNPNAAEVLPDGKIRIKAADTCTLVVYHKGNAEWLPTTITEAMMQFTRGTLTVAADNKQITYGDALPALGYQITGFAYGETAGVLAQPVQISTTATGSSGIGTYPITVGGAAADNYTFTYQQGTLTIRPKKLEIVLAAIADKAYGAADFALGITASPELPLTFSSSQPGVATIDAAGNIHITGVGTTSIAAMQQTGGNYTGDTAVVTLRVTQASQTINFQPIPAKTFGDADFAPQAQSSAGLPLTFTSSDANVATITADGNIHITGAGTATITATQSGNTNYNGATATATLTVDKASQTIVFQPLPDKTVADADFAPQAQSSAGLLLTFTSSDPNVATITAGGNIHIAGAGTATITATQSGNNNYNSATATATLRVGKAAQTITFQPIPVKTFGDADFTPQAQSSTGLPLIFTSSDGNVATVTAGGHIHITGAGTATITATQSGNANYDGATATVVLTVNKAAQTVTIDPLTAKAFGDADFIAGARASSGLPLTFSSSDANVATIAANGTIHITGAGTVTITATQAGNGNYMAASATASFTVGKGAQQITFTDLPVKTFGDADFAANAAASSGLPVIYSSSDATVATISANGTIHIVGAGTATITVTQPGNGNYAAASTVSKQLVVRKAPQTITFPPLTARNINEPPFDPAATASSGLPVTYEIENANLATIANGLVTPERAGITRITARQAGNHNFEAAAAVTRELEIVSSGREIQVGDAVTPNGDGVNDYLPIEGLRNFPDNEIHIANASGRIVFEAKPYRNDFRGYANHGSQLLPKGVYYYVFIYTSGGTRKKVTGFFVLEY